MLKPTIHRRTTSTPRPFRFGSFVVGVYVSLNVVLLAGFSADEMTTDSGSIEESEVNNRLENATDTVELGIRLHSMGQYERTVKLHQVFDKWNAVQLGEAFRQAEDVGSRTIRDEIQEVAVRRMAMIEPKQALSIISDLPDFRRLPLVSIVYQEWSVSALEASVEHALSLDNSERRTVVEGILHARYDLSEETLRKIAGSLDQEDITIDALAVSMLEIPMDNPEEAWQSFIVAHGSNVSLLSEAQFKLLSHIAMSWFKESGSDVPGAILEYLRDDTSRIRVLTPLLESVAKDNPQFAFKLTQDIAGLNPSVGGRVMDRVIAQWAQSDVVAALAATALIDNLAVRARCELAAIEEWANNDAQELLSSIDQIPAYLRTIGKLEALRNVARESPESVVDSIAEFENDSDRRSLVLAISMSWSEIDPGATLRWLRTSSEVERLNTRFSQFQVRMQQRVLAEMVKRGDIQLALELSTDQSIPVWQGWVIGEVAYQRGSAAAIEMLHQVRDPIARQSSYHGIGSAFINEGRSNQAIELISQESPEDQYKYFLDLRGHWAEDPQDLFSKLDSLPTEQIKKELAAILAATNSGYLSLTSDQKDALRDIVSPAFHDALD